MLKTASVVRFLGKRIPSIQIVIGTKRQTVTVNGAVDTGSEGLASVRPFLAQQLGIKSAKTQQILTASGSLDVPVGVVDILGVQGFPDCNLGGAEVLIHDFPGYGDVLLGERFFEKFTFDIDYASGKPIVTCGKYEAPSWIAPTVLTGSLAAVGVAIYLIVSK